MTAVTAGEQLGLNAKTYYNTGTHGSPTWVEITRAKEVSIPIKGNEAKIDSRASGYQFFLKGLIEVGLELGYMYTRGTDTVWTALITNALARVPTPIEFWCGDDTITLVGARGIIFTGNVFGFDQDQPLEEGITHKVSIKPHSTLDPALSTT